MSVRFAEECSGAGGQYIFARDLYPPYENHFLGEHACQSWKLGALPPEASLTWGVIRYVPTSTEQTVPAGWCIAFDDGNAQDALVTHSRVNGIALFATRENAEHFAQSLGWRAP